MINSKYIPMYVRYFWQPSMSYRCPDKPLPEQTEVEKIHARILCLDTRKRNELFKMISANYELKIIKKKTFLSLVQKTKED